jgi:CubicO group peptidase (beta-lactamase class C family)
MTSRWNAGSGRTVDRRRMITWGGLAAAGAAVGGVPFVGGGIGRADAAPASPDGIPPDLRPGGAFDRYLARLAARDAFSGVVLLSYRGRQVLSRSYGMADRENKIRNRMDTAFNLSSAGQPFLSVALLQLMQRGKLAVSDTVGRHLTGVAKEIADRVTIHHLLTGTSGMDAPMPDWQRVFHSREEVHANVRRWVREATLVGVPGAASNGHTAGAGVGLAMAALILEAVSGMTFWDYVHQHVFRPCGMRGSGFFTRDQWLTDKHLAHPYLLLSDGSLVDAVRHLDQGSVAPDIVGRNPGRGFIGHASGGSFATAPDLVRFADALRNGTVLSRPYAELFAQAKLPGPAPTSFDGYTMPVSIVNGQWVFGRGGGNGGIGSDWTVYPDTGWVSVVLTNRDGVPFLDLLLRLAEAITGAPVDRPGGG